jgi:hypothetical protein
VLNTALYALARAHAAYRADFHDITVGTNALSTPDGSFTFPGFNAAPGYDLATGLGTPDVANLIRDLVRMPSDRHGQDGRQHASGDGNPQGGQGMGSQDGGGGGQHHMNSGR